MSILHNTNRYTVWKIGDKAQIQTTILREDVYAFVDLVGDTNPLHKNDSMDHSAPLIVPGAMLSGLATGLVGSQLPGAGCILVSQDSTYLLPVYADDLIKICAEIIDKDDEKKYLRIAIRCLSDQQETLMTGTIVVLLRKR